MRLLLLLALVAACGGKDNSPRGLCERGCKKLLGCGNQDDQIAACIDTCAQASPKQAVIEQIENLTCEQLAAGAGPSLGAGAAPTAPARGTCTADCRGCAGDGTSCYAVAGGANGIPCEPCCCQPGGGAPVWNTP